MNVVLGAVAFVLYTAVAVLLVSKYQKTNDTGFLWLGLPLVLLPIVAVPLAFWVQIGTDRLALGQHLNHFPFSLVEQGHLTIGRFLTLLNFVEHLVWGILSLLAVLALNRGRKSPDREKSQRSP